MKIYELFSKRQKKLRGEVPDVYQYKTIPPELRVQVIHIWFDIWGEETLNASYDDNPHCNAYRIYNSIHQDLCREYGCFTLGPENNLVERVTNFLLKIEDTEKVIDVVELSFQYIDQVVRDKPYLFSPMHISPDEAIDELNDRFREHGVGYQYESGQIIKVDSQFIHSEAIKPTLIMLSAPMYEGANEEFLNAHEHYRERRYKECLNDCLKAFESCLKTICQKRGWHHDSEKDTANNLIQIVLSNGLIPVFMESHFSGLKSALGSGLSTLRNRRAGHGQGPEKVVVPEYVAAYALHLTASNILLLAKADENMDRS